MNCIRCKNELHNLVAGWNNCVKCGLPMFVRVEEVANKNVVTENTIKRAVKNLLRSLASKIKVKTV